MEHSLDDQMMRLAESQLQQQATQERRARKRGWDVEPEPSSMPQTAPGAPMPGSMEAQLRSMGAQLPGITAGVVPNGGPPGMSPPGMASSGMGPGGGLPSNFAIASVPNSLSGMMQGGMGGMQQRPGPPIPGVDGNWTCPQCAHVNFGARKNCQKCGAHAPGGGIAGGGDDAIDTAAGTCLQSVAHLEKEFDFDKLRWKVASVFRKAANAMSFQGNLQSLIDDYADKAFQQLASAIGDRDWLPQVDLTLVLNVAVKQCFPPQVLAQAGPLGVENMVLPAYDRSFDETRVMGLLWESIKGRVDGKKTQNKVYASLEAARNESVRALSGPTADPSVLNLPTIEKVQRFVSRWIGGTVDQIAKAHQGDPHTALPSNIASAMFQHLLDSGTMPIFLTRELQTQGIQVPSPYPDLDGVVTTAYQPYAARAVKRQRTQQTFQMPMAKTAYCFYHYNGSCGFGAQCRYAHSEMELPPHLWLCAPWSNDPAAW
mmetsp:Transcript_64860/g.101077  ORF Transcript_64860/g.101077 Transcript_64860/m.101077 type:complete len:485 (-) Transcript_64860:163-1617(-)